MQAKILKLVDVSYGGENGFNQAIELSTEILTNVKFIQEKKLISKYDSYMFNFINLIITFNFLTLKVNILKKSIKIRENIVSVLLIH